MAVSSLADYSYHTFLCNFSDIYWYAISYWLFIFSLFVSKCSVVAKVSRKPQSKVRGEGRGGEGWGAGPTPCVWGRAGVLSWMGRTQAERSLPCWWGVPPHHASLSRHTHWNTLLSVFSLCKSASSGSHWLLKQSLTSLPWYSRLLPRWAQRAANWP